MSYKSSRFPRIIVLVGLGLLVSPLVFVAAKSLFANGLADYFHDDIFDPRADWPLAADNHAEVAAETCGIEDWEWASVIVFDGAPSEEPYFGYEIASLPGEEVPYEGTREGRSWDRSERIRSINACLCKSFDKQQVRVNLAAPALLYSIQGPNVSESDTI